VVVRPPAPNRFWLGREIDFKRAVSRQRNRRTRIVHDLVHIRDMKGIAGCSGAKDFDRFVCARDLRRRIKKADGHVSAGGALAVRYAVMDHAHHAELPGLLDANGEFAVLVESADSSFVNQGEENEARPTLKKSLAPFPTAVPSQGAQETQQILLLLAESASKFSSICATSDPLPS
jgi:hypothetical protein